MNERAKRVMFVSINKLLIMVIENCKEITLDSAQKLKHYSITRERNFLTSHLNEHIDRFISNDEIQVPILDLRVSHGEALSP